MIHRGEYIVVVREEDPDEFIRAVERLEKEEGCLPVGEDHMKVDGGVLVAFYMDTNAARKMSSGGMDREEVRGLAAVPEKVPAAAGGLQYSHV